MTQSFLKTIHIYPVKSASGIALSSSDVEELGLAFDRRFVVTDIQGTCITGRSHQALCLVSITLNEQGMMLSAPNMPEILLDFQQITEKYTQVKVWDDVISGRICSAEVNRWLSLYLKTPCQLLFFGEKSQRFVRNLDNSQGDTQVSFADGYPLLLISTSSLAALNQHYSDTKEHIPMAQFRPNLVVDNCTAFAEDSWRLIRIGQVAFEVVKPCSRCIFTTINTETAEKHQQQEPLTTLKTFRQNADGDILFGQNLIALNKGEINVGDSIEVLSTQAPPVFIKASIAKKSTQLASSKSTTIKSQKPRSAKPNITFNRFNKTIVGNKKKSLLEQGEDAGLLLPYSCRAGMCGRCKVKLEQGEVRQNCQDGLSAQEIAQGYILTCSAIPLTDVEVSHPINKRNK